MALTGGAAAPALAGAEGAAAGAGAAGATGAGLGGAFGSADMLATGVGGGAGLLGGTTGAATAVPGTTESMGLLDMGGGNFVNPEYFVGEGMGMPMYAGSPDAPFMERAGNVLGSMGDKFQSGMGGDAMKAMRMMNMGGQQQPQQVSRSPAIQRPQSQPATQAQSLYSQPISGSLQLTDEQKAMLRQRMMGGQYGGLIG